MRIEGSAAYMTRAARRDCDENRVLGVDTLFPVDGRADDTVEVIMPGCPPQRGLDAPRAGNQDGGEP